MSGTSYDYGFRIYDPRVARFLSIDPLFQSYPFYTPYQFAGNNPVKFIDLDGLERALPKQNTGKTQMQIYNEKYGKPDIHNPRGTYGNKQVLDKTGWGFGQEFNPANEKSKPSFGGTTTIENPLERETRNGEDSITLPILQTRTASC